MLESLATSNTELIPKYKIFFSKAYSTNAIHYPEPILAKPNEICTESFLSIGSFKSESEQANCYSYMQTKFFKFLLYLGKGTMNVSKEVFKLIPLQDFSQAWSDELLYKKYGLSDEERAYIESRIKGM
ncbi:hypothetical protein [Helicobacter sp.]|uniref:hypothetical protein n=1 Tax=Helicobacter sp. TaxID=218 RepID=UPI0025C49AD0|nr:hypothetical protein [Helicobacter sp.]MBR2494952.1 hypothetical protein [Helicobacter sp.]